MKGTLVANANILPRCHPFVHCKINMLNQESYLVRKMLEFCRTLNIIQKPENLLAFHLKVRIVEVLVGTDDWTNRSIGKQVRLTECEGLQAPPTSLCCR